MKNESDTNPFDEEEHSPLPKNAAAGFNSRFPTVASGPIGFGRQYDDATISIPLDTISDSSKRGKDFAALEVDSTRRETDLELREVANKVGEPNDKNWPSFFPIIHHDIANDIPAHFQLSQKLAFASWLGLILCLSWNVFAVTLFWIMGAAGGLILFILAIIYALAGCPLSYFLWYRPLYRAMRTESALSCIWFSVFLAHLLFCCLAFLTLPINNTSMFLALSFTGLFSTIVVFLERYFVAGALYVIGFGFFCVEASLSFIVLLDAFSTQTQLRVRQRAQTQP